MSPQRPPQRFTHAGSTFSASTFFSSALSASVAFTSTIGESLAGEPILQDGRLALQSMPSWVNSTPPNCHCLSVSSLKLSSRKRRTSGESLFHHDKFAKYPEDAHESGSVYWWVVTSYHLAAFPLPEPVIAQSTTPRSSAVYVSA